MSPQVDRPAAIRAALRRLVARNGFHGASMSAVAAEAGVATGTAYVHYASKDDLVLATYLEVKRELGAAAVDGLDPSAPPEARFRRMWHAVHRHLAAEPDRAGFLIQVDASPYAKPAHELAMARSDDPMAVEAARPDLAARLTPLPPEVLYDLGFGPAVRMAATGEALPDAALDDLASACWRAITRPAPPARTRPRERPGTARRHEGRRRKSR